MTGWIIAYWTVAAVVVLVGCVVTWRSVVLDDGDVGDLAALWFIAFGAGVLWPALPFLYAMHRLLERAKRKHGATQP